MRIAIVCGGTGGHIYPGIAIAKELKEPFFITGKKGISCEIIKKSGFRVYTIPISFWKRRLFSLNTLGVIFCNIFCIIASFFILIKERPKAIIGMGGYPSFPPILASLFLGIKRIIHEQNAKMGLANRLVSKIATKVALSFENTEFAPKNAIFTGCPIRKGIGKIGREEGLSFFGLKNKKTILVMGGSQGSTKINEVFLEVTPNLLEFNIIWLTGKKDYSRIKSALRTPHSAIKIFPFLFEMEYAYAGADIVIGRAGAVSIAEIRRCGIPAILIPYPYSADQHQLKNAEALKDAIVIKEENLSKDSLLDAIFKVRNKEKSPFKLQSTEKFLKLLYG
ncbi:MAG: undecaprenyldiphospho-muramoylpentapeptide beta-N-acetylglucosaminyltransferase [bacterium]